MEESNLGCVFNKFDVIFKPRRGGNITFSIMIFVALYNWRGAIFTADGGAIHEEPPRNALDMILCQLVSC